VRNPSLGGVHNVFCLRFLPLELFGSWRSFAAVMGLIGIAGCSYDASLQRETSNGGLVTFSVQSESDVLSSDGRRDALRIMQEKCPSGVQIVKEGEVPKVSRAADRAWGPQIGTDRIWGIQFICK
jgi:hypothetical protein